jgi:hypothetical protein
MAFRNSCAGQKLSLYFAAENYKSQVRGIYDRCISTRRGSATPSPKGKMAIDEKTGVFTYTPAAEDKDEIVVWIRARKGAKVEKQQVFITPQPQLPPEFNCIEHVSEKEPVKDSRLYTTFAEQDAEELFFNREGLASDKKVMTKKVMVSGVKLVIERSNDAGSLYKRLTGRTDLKELTLCADEVVIGCELKLPGTDVNIYARRLSFKDSSSETGCITTTPNPITAVSKPPQEGTLRPGTEVVGLDGQKGGDVRLYVRDLDTPGTAKRIITVGGTGQEGYPGIPGSDGEDLTGPQRWSLKFRVENTDFDYSKGIVLNLGYPGDSGALIGAKVIVEYMDGWGKVVDTKTFEFGRFPHGHTNYKAPTGRPGRGRRLNPYPVQRPTGKPRPVRRGRSGEKSRAPSCPQAGKTQPVFYGQNFLHEGSLGTCVSSPADD